MWPLAFHRERACDAIIVSSSSNGNIIMIIMMMIMILDYKRVSPASYAPSSDAGTTPIPSRRR